MTEPHNGILVLEDGSVFYGTSLGAEGEFVGEVVFNTSMTGYQEIITDPSYWGQMVAFTCPHIGNVGVNAEDAESRQPYVRAVLARQICTSPSNWRSQQALPEYLRAWGIPALAGLDTRRLTLILRQKGVLRAALCTTHTDVSRAQELAHSTPDMSTLAPVGQVSRPAAEEWRMPVPLAWRPDTGAWDASTLVPRTPERHPHVAVLDCGTKHNILRHLASLGARVTVLPFDSSAEAIRTLCPDGVLIANGPGDPECVPETVASIRQLIAEMPTRGALPILGICLGHQIIALASGARTYKLPFGHHGGNHPVQDLESGRIEITAQNHNYGVQAESLCGLPLEVTHRNLNDQTIEGLRHTQLPIRSVQYHPEASPGPHDSLGILRRFVRSP